MNEARESWRSIKKRKTGYVRKTDKGWQRIRDERRWRDKIAELETKLR